MLNDLQAGLTTRLRQRSGLTRTQFAEQLGISRNTLHNYESGITRPDSKTERKMAEVCRCSKLEVAEILCELLSEKLQRRIHLSSDVPGLALTQAEHVRQGFSNELTDAELRTLGNRMHTAQLLQLAWQRTHSELQEYVADCRANAERRRAAAATPTSGASGPATVAEPVFHNAETGRRPGHHLSTPAGADFHEVKNHDT